MKHSLHGEETDLVLLRLSIMVMKNATPLTPLAKCATDN